MESIFSIRPVRKNSEDLDILAKFCHELAEFDGHKANLDAAKLKRTLFHPGTNVRAFLGYRHDKAIGFILAYESYTAYHGERGLYVPGAYVIEKYRHLGYGIKMLDFLADFALRNDFDFMNWVVEENNVKANAIYKKLGADISTGWSYVRVSKRALEQMAKRKA